MPLRFKARSPLAKDVPPSAGEPEAEDLWREVQDHLGDVFRLVYGAVGHVPRAEDITQDVFEIALNKIDQLRDPTRLRAWLMTIAANEVRQHFRRRREHVPWGPTIEKQTSLGNDPYAEIDAHRAVARTLSQLPPLDRLVIVLHGLLGHSHAEVAAILSIREAAAQKRWQRARARFAQKNLEAQHAD